MRLIILAAGRGTRLAPLTDDRPKCMVELAGRPLIAWQIAAARQAGINDIAIVGGYRADQLPASEAEIILNPAYASTNMVRSLFCAEDRFDDGFIMSYGDIVYNPSVIESLMAADGDIAVVIDRQWRSYWKARFDNPLDDAETLRMGADGAIMEIGQPAASYDDVQGQYIGMVRFNAAGVGNLRGAFADATRDHLAGRPPFGGKRSLDALYMTDLLQGMIDGGRTLTPAFIDGDWAEVDSPHDLEIARTRMASLVEGIRH